MASTLERAIAYLGKLDPAVSGSGGHDQTLRAACECVRFGLSDDESWQALQWFNEYRCQPKWKDSELRHKLNDAQKIVGQSGKVGAHVSRTTFRAGSRRQWQAPQPPVRRAVVKPVVPVYLRSEAEEEAWWGSVAGERGMTLEEFDVYCGNVVVEEPVEEVFIHA